MIRTRAFGLIPLVLGLLGTVAGAEPAPELAHYMPARDLVGYCEFDGLDAHRDAWRGTAAHALLNGTTAGAMMDDLARQVLDEFRKKAPDRLPAGADLLALKESIARQGFALGTYDDGSTVLVLRKAGARAARTGRSALAAPCTPTRGSPCPRRSASGAVRWSRSRATPWPA